MADSLKLQIVTPAGLQLDEQVHELTAPSTEGQFGVMPGHRPMLASLKTGIVSFVHAGKETSVAVGPGFVEINGDSAVVLTDEFCRKADVDPVRVRLELKEVDEAIAAYSGEPGGGEFIDLVAKELWAAARLELYGDPPPATVRTVYEFRSTDLGSGEEGSPDAL